MIEEVPSPCPLPAGERVLFKLDVGGVGAAFQNFPNYPYSQV